MIRNSDLSRKVRIFRIIDRKASRFTKNFWSKLYLLLLLVTIFVACRHSYYILNEDYNSIHFLMIISSVLIMLKLFQANKYILKLKGFIAKLKAKLIKPIIEKLDEILNGKVKIWNKKYGRYKRVISALILISAMLCLLIDVINYLYVFSMHEAIWDVLKLSSIYSILFFVYFIFSENLEVKFDVNDYNVDLSASKDKSELGISKEEQVTRVVKTEEKTVAETTNNKDESKTIEIKKDITIKNKDLE